MGTPESVPQPSCPNPAVDGASHTHPPPPHPPRSRLEVADAAGLRGGEGARRRRVDGRRVRRKTGRPTRGEPRQALRNRAQPENHKWRGSFGGMRWRKSTTARTTAPNLATLRAASSMSVRSAILDGTRSSSKRNRPPRRRPRNRWRPPPPPDHDRAVVRWIVAGGGWDSGGPCGGPPRDRVPGLPRRHQTVPARHLPIPRTGPHVVRGTAGTSVCATC